VADGESNTNIPNIQTSVSGAGVDATMTINMTGVQDPSTYEWVALAGTGESGQNVWVTVDDKPKSIVVYNNSGDEGEAVLADIVFTVDNSGSMYEEADAIARDIVSWAQYLAQSGLNARFGVVGYGGFISGAINLTTATELSDYLNEYSGVNRTMHFGGTDATALRSYASSFDRTTTYSDVSWNECGALAIRFADRYFNFRTGANRIYVNFTDEPNQPNGQEGYSVKFFESQTNWPAAKGTVHTVFSDYQFTNNNWNYEEQPWLISEYTGGTQLFTSSSFSGVTLQSLPVTGAMQHSYIIRFTNIGEFMDGKPHKVVMTIYTPDGSVKAVKTFDVIFGGEVNGDTTNNSEDVSYNADGTPNGNVNQLYGKWYLEGFGASMTSMNGKSEGEYMEILNEHELIWGGQLNGHDDPYKFYYEDNKIYFESETGNGYTTYFEVVYITENEMILYQPSSKLYRHWVTK